MRTVREHSLATLLLYCQRDLLARMTPHLDAHDVTAEQWRVLSALQDRDGVPMAELAASAVLPPPTLTRTMDRLVERGIVMRSIDRNDRRKIVAILTPAGERVAEDLRSCEAETEQRLVDQLGQEQFDLMAGLLTSLAAGE
ncbi:MAG: MarR family transcriptional regulator [Mycolicibacterium mageritense]|nr:MAG: MarR family transcriptional regulator [Mycolicibacterium mageritense]